MVARLTLSFDCRVRGRAMLTAAAVLMVGYALIDAGGLTAEDYDFGGQTGSLARLVDESPLGQLLPLTFTHGGLKVCARARTAHSERMNAQGEYTHWWIVWRPSDTKGA